MARPNSLVLAGLALAATTACRTPHQDLSRGTTASVEGRSTTASVEGRGATASVGGRGASAPVGTASAVPMKDAVPTVVSEERAVHFTWKPAQAGAREYAMPDAEDQHRILLTRGTERGKAYPVVVALHGQPRRGQAPRSYAFLRVVADTARALVAAHEVDPLVLVSPVFRFEGQNWPRFDWVAFMNEVDRVLGEYGITRRGTYVFGHSGAAGCGGEGLNRVALMSPTAVGFFDTCLGAGFVQATKELASKRIPTLIVHSVETAGYRPRQPIEYDGSFDFGKVYGAIGLRPSTCPSSLPEVPLRSLAYRCATNDAGTTRALVLDTGAGEKAHEAVVPVAMRYFLREYLPRE